MEDQDDRETSRLTGRMLDMDREWAVSDSESESDSEDEGKGRRSGYRVKGDVKDSEGRELPAAERAPIGNGGGR